MSSDYYSSLAGSSSLATSNAASSTNSNNNNNACTSTRWLTEEVFALIDLVQRNEAIYNPRHKYYFCRPYVENFWREVDLKLEKNPGASLAKWTNLRISFRREYTNYLEEKVPPCWTYFDRMFFLHPYLRKKHQQSKSLDSQVQDALVQISSLSNRLQRERAVAAAAASSISQPSNIPSPSQPQLDNYLEYFDDPEPNHSELDDMIDDEPPNTSQFAHSTLASDIKSECEDNVDEYDTVERPGDDEDHDADDADMRNFVFSSLEKRQQQQQHHQRMQHLQRLQSRTFYDEFRNKRARSHENISSSQTHATTPLLNSSSSNHSNNVSFVRPTFAKPLEVVSTTTQGHGVAGNHNNSSNSSTASNTSLPNDNEPVSNSTPRSSSSHHHTSSAHYSSSSALTHPPHHHPRFEISGINTQSSTAVAPVSTQQQHSNTPNTASLVPVPSAATPELCDCKTDPDAMFLMSLLPDIQKLNGRDRGKIKIAFQNILQDYLYPD